MRSGLLHRRLTASTNPFPHFPASLHTCTMTVGPSPSGAVASPFRYVIGVADRDLPLPPASPGRPGPAQDGFIWSFGTLSLDRSRTPKPRTHVRIAWQGRAPPSSRTRQRLLDLWLHDLIDVFRRDRPYQLVSDLAVPADDEGFRDTVDAPFDCRASADIGARSCERIAVAAEESPRIVGLVFVIDADQPDARIASKLHQQRGLVVTGHTP